MEPHKTDMLLHSKGYHSKWKTTEWEKVFSNYTPNRGSIVKINKELKNLEIKKTQLKSEVQI